MGAAIFFPKFFVSYSTFDGSKRNKMAAQCLLSGISSPLDQSLSVTVARCRRKIRLEK